MLVMDGSAQRRQLHRGRCWQPDTAWCAAGCASEVTVRAGHPPQTGGPEGQEHEQNTTQTRPPLLESLTTDYAQLRRVT